MCSHKILAHNETGYIAICTNCEHYQIAFGTTVMSLPEQQYKEFAEHLYMNCTNKACLDFPAQKSVVLPVFCAHLQMILSFNELLRLEELMRQASVMTEVNKIIDR